MCSRDLSTAMCCSRLISFTSVNHNTDPTPPLAIKASGFSVASFGFTTPDDWFNWPTFSSSVICCSKATALPCASSLDMPRTGRLALSTSRQTKLTTAFDCFPDISLGLSSFSLRFQDLQPGSPKPRISIEHSPSHRQCRLHPHKILDFDEEILLRFSRSPLASGSDLELDFQARSPRPPFCDKGTISGAPQTLAIEIELPS